MEEDKKVAEEKKNEVEVATEQQQPVINKKSLKVKKILKWIMWILVLLGVGAGVAHVTKKVRNRPTDNGTVNDNNPAEQQPEVKEEPRQQENNNQPNNGWKDRNRHGQQNGGNNNNKKW